MNTFIYYLLYSNNLSTLLRWDYTMWRI